MALETGFDVILETGINYSTLFNERKNIIKKIAIPLWIMLLFLVGA